MYRKTCGTRKTKRRRRKSLHALSDNDGTFLLLSVRSFIRLISYFHFLHAWRVVGVTQMEWRISWALALQTFKILPTLARAIETKKRRKTKTKKIISRKKLSSFEECWGKELLFVFIHLGHEMDHEGENRIALIYGRRVMEIYGRFMGMCYILSG